MLSSPNIDFTFKLDYTSFTAVSQVGGGAYELFKC